MCADGSPCRCAFCSANAVLDIPRRRRIEEYHGSEVYCKTWLRFLVKPRRLYKAEPEVNTATAITMVVQGYEK